MKKHIEKDAPQGELVLRTLAMPADTNANGDIFGGWLVSQMDLGGAILGYQISNARLATVAINDLVFIEPVNIGDIVSCYANLISIGNTSITIQVEAWTARRDLTKIRQVTEGTFVYVALDENRKPQRISPH